jgi:hypothetical protein
MIEKCGVTPACRKWSIKFSLVLPLTLLFTMSGDSFGIWDHRSGTVVGSVAFVDKAEMEFLRDAANVTIALERKGPMITIVSDNQGDFIVKLSKGTYCLKSAIDADRKLLRFSPRQTRCFKITPDQDTRFDVMLLKP